MSQDPTYHAALSAAADRNKDPILAVLKKHLPKSGTILEIASGTGQHAAHFARGLKGVVWQPSDPDPEMLRSIIAWNGPLIEEGRVLEPMQIDVRAERWGIAAADGILCCNMIHIAPWASCEALFAGAAKILSPNAPLILYGPFKIDGKHTAPSNETFDAGLRNRDPALGVRDLADVIACADAAGFDHDKTVDMPSNTKSIIFRRRK